MAQSEHCRYIVQVFVGALSDQYEALSVEASKQTSSEEIVSCIADKLDLDDVTGSSYELAEVVGDVIGGECKERRLSPNEYPVAVMLLWPNNTAGQYYRFYLREKISEEPWMDNFSVDPQLIKDYFQRFLYQPKDREYPDLCQLPDLNEQTLLDNLRARFFAGYIYTYVGSILIALNPFKFYPIYNPKYVKLYQNRRLGHSLPPHIFAVADTAYHCMLKERTNQCIVISGESGSGKTESTNFLLHHLTALSQKGSYGSGVEQTILSAGPVLEAFGNAKTAHNNNSSRFGKFIQVNYKENGMVHGAVVQKYLLEKSRICSQGRNERNYHVFYYLLAGASEQERQDLHLMSVDKYQYLSKSGICIIPGVDESYEFSRLKQSMEMVGFTLDKQKRLFAVLSAVLLLGNVEFQPRKSYHHDEAVSVRNPEVVSLISQLLKVKKETLMAALTAKRARASGETLVINYRLPEAIATRDAMAKCLYGALFDWIVMQVNHALLSKKDTLREHQGNSIGVLDIFGFEDFGMCNSFEQLCINYANEHLQYYFNQHVFKYEQEEYKREHIKWTDIEFSDNTQCLQLIEGKPRGLLCVLDDQCNFPWATNETLLQKYNSLHEDNPYYEKPQKKEPAFIVKHYAGKVKYQASCMREKNLDLMRADIVGVLKNSSLAFVRELVGVDPVAVFRWAILRAFFRGYFAFHEAGRRARAGRADVQRPHIRNDSILSHSRNKSSHKTKDTSTVYNDNIQRYGRESYSQRTASKLPKLHKHGPRIQHSEHSVGFVDNADVMHRASQIVMKNKSFRPRERAKKGLKNLQSVKTLAGRTGSMAGTTASNKGRKQPMTVAAQFQQSLHALMDTLNQANPFFIRCIKSNSEKIPNVFDEETVQRQLRYTGMLETVRIRQAGYNVRLTYDEFIQLYRILLPKGLLSSQSDVRHFLATLNLNRDNYQLGVSKIFMRESEQTKLEYRLHQQIMASIITIQRWFRAVLERRRFLALRKATIIIQRYSREWLKHRDSAARFVQAWWRGAVVRRWYQRLRRATIRFQAHARGHLIRRTLLARRRQHAMIEPPHSINAEDKDQPYKINDIFDVQLNTRLSEEEDRRGALMRTRRSLVAMQSLPIPKHSFKACDSLDSSTAQTYCKRKVNKIQNLADITHEQNITSVNRSPIQTANKITPDNLATEMIWLELDKINTNNKNEDLVEESVQSITKCSEEYLRQQARNCTEISHTDGKSKSRRTTPTYHRSLSSTNLESSSLFSLPPVRRPEGSAHRTEKQVAPVVPLRKSRQLNNAAGDLKKLVGPKPLQSKEVDMSPSGSSNDILPMQLRRRNSDPAPNNEQIIGVDKTGLFKIAGHSFAAEPATRVSKMDKCKCCHSAIDVFASPAQRCIECKQLFHTICIQNKIVFEIPCRGRRKYRKSHTTNHTSQAKQVFNLTGTSEFTDRTDMIISDAEELQRMQNFITHKIYKMETNNLYHPNKKGNENSEADRVFKHALREFKDNLTATYSVVNKQGSALKYKDLIANFLHVMETVCQREGSCAERFPVTMGVNAFRGFMNEFMRENARHETEKTRTKRKKDKKRKVDDVINFAGHTFILTVIHIRTECEICKIFLWPIEKSLICQTCKMACHKKCYLKITNHCRKEESRSTSAVVVGVEGSRPVGLVFGRPLSMIPAVSEGVPIIVHNLLHSIEIQGIYVEGLYRKSGLSSKVQELKKILDENPDEVELDQYAVHVRAAVLKSFFREMPEPLLTYDLYDSFILAAKVTDPQDRVTTLFSLLNKLPTPNYNLMERLTFHLALVARAEKHNRMGANALAIVFAPCILRSSKIQSAQDSLQDIARQTLCVETIIVERLRTCRNKLDQIKTLDDAQTEAQSQLLDPNRGEVVMNQQIIENIRIITREQIKLTETLSQIERTNSDEDLLSNSEGEGSLDELRPQKARINSDNSVAV